MISTPVTKLGIDVIGSFILAGILFFILHYVNDPTVVLQNMESFTSTTTTALGLLFTILAIIYTFESQFENNSAVRILRQRGQYQDIIEIFVLSVATIGIIWIVTFGLTITEPYSPYGYTIQSIFAYVVIVGFILLIARLRRCFWIFVLLNRAIDAQDEVE